MSKPWASPTFVQFPKLHSFCKFDAQGSAFWLKHGNSTSLGCERLSISNFEINEELLNDQNFCGLVHWLLSGDNLAIFFRKGSTFIDDKLEYEMDENYTDKTDQQILKEHYQYAPIH